MRDFLISFFLAFTLVLVGASLSGCTAEDASREALLDEGYTDIEFTGYSVFGCSDDDTFHTGFRAHHGDREVEGVVCCGILKSCTIRH